MTFRQIQLTDKPLLDTYIQAYQPQISDLSFTNLFIWRKKYNTHWTIIDDCLWIQYQALSGQPLLAPICHDLSAIASSLRKLMRQTGKQQSPLSIIRAEQYTIGQLAQLSDIHFTSQTQRDHFDYIYLHDELTHLPGSRFHAKRNHISQFLRRYPNWQLRDYAATDYSACVAMAVDSCERQTIEAMLTNYQSLDGYAQVFTIDDALAGFIIGEQISREMIVLHFQHARHDIHGAFPIMEKTFLQQAPFKATYVNKEQDLGLANLRKAKLSYHPHYFLFKYRLTITR
jgi:hypothetical protein